MDYNGYFSDALARLQSERRYRVFADLEALVDVWERLELPRRRHTVAAE